VLGYAHKAYPRDGMHGRYLKARRRSDPFFFTHRFLAASSVISSSMGKRKSRSDPPIDELASGLEMSLAVLCKHGEASLREAAEMAESVKLQLQPPASESLPAESSVPSNPPAPASESPDGEHEPRISTGISAEPLLETHAESTAPPGGTVAPVERKLRFLNQYLDVVGLLRQVLAEYDPETETVRGNELLFHRRDDPDSADVEKQSRCTESLLASLRVADGLPLLRTLFFIDEPFVVLMSSLSSSESTISLPSCLF